MWCPKTDVFQIIDCWNNFEYFKVTPKGKEPKPQIPLPVRFAGIRIDKVEAALALGQTSIAEKEIGVLRALIAALPARSITIMEAKEQLAQCRTEKVLPPPESERGSNPMRTRYQHGSLQRDKRRNGPDVWIYRWREYLPNGKMQRRGEMIGTIEEYPTKADAQRASEHLAPNSK